MNKINIALPKGRLLKKVYDLFKKIGYENKELLEDNRKLVFEDKGVRYLIVKPSDVGIYVKKEVVKGTQHMVAIYMTQWVLPIPKVDSRQGCRSGPLAS